MLLEIVLGLVIIAAVIVVVLLLFFFKKPYRWKKEIKGDKTTFTFEARRDIKKIELSGKFGNEKIKFERRNIKKGEKIEFDYPASDQPATLVVETEGGRKSYEV